MRGLLGPKSDWIQDNVTGRMNMMPRRFLLAAALVAASTVVVTPASATGAHTTKFSASLSAKQEVVKVKKVSATAGGTFIATLSGSTLTWSLNVSHLSGPVTTAHIAQGTKGNLGPLLVVLCNPCKSPRASGTTRVSSVAVRDMANGDAYVNVFTKAHPNGELRGQVR
jgi:hypothetical protein